MAVYINAVEGMARGRFPAHIGKERRKIVLPALTDDDAAPAVAFKSGLSRILTSASHTHPCVVFRAPVVHAGFAVDSHTRGKFFSIETATTLLPTHESATRHSHRDPALTAALPMNIMVFSGPIGPADNTQTAEASACQIFKGVRWICAPRTRQRTSASFTEPHHAGVRVKHLATDRTNTFDARHDVLYYERTGRWISAIDLLAALRNPGA